MSVLPTFTRASTAYKEDGTSVASGVPRIESSGVKIEEGTTNLMTSTNSQSISSAVTVTVISGSTYSVSCKSGTITLSGAGIGTVTSITTKTIIATSTLLVLTPTTTATYIQVELKAYATSFTPTTRSSETLMIPSSALSVTEGTIEFDYTPINQPLSDMTAQPKKPKIMQIGNYGEGISLWRYPQGLTDKIAILGAYTSTWNLSAFSNYSFTLNQKVRIALRWKTTNTFDAWIGGVPIIVNAISPVPFTAMGNVVFGDTTGSGGVNALFSNVRVSNKYLSDTEMAYTGNLSVDYNTTYLLPCKTSLTPKNF